MANLIRKLEMMKSTDSGNWQPLTTAPGSNTETFTGNTTWTCPAWVTSVLVECWGGGGAGSGRATSNGRGGGGGGGAYASNNITVTPGTGYSIVIGAGGLAGTSSGNAGGNTTFGTGPLVRAAGGQPGLNSAANGTGGAGGSIANSIGATIYIGGAGANGNGTAGGGGGGGAGSTGNGGNATNNTGGTGTSQNGGNGANGATANGAGSTGLNYGGGGSGARRNGGSLSGGNGAQGYLSLTYTPAPPIVLSASGNIATTGEDTTAQLTAPSGKTSGGNFSAGRLSEDTNPTTGKDFSSNQYTEDEWCLQAVSGVAVVGDTWQFRLSANGVAYNNYNATPQWTIGGLAIPPFRRKNYTWRKRF